MGQSDSRAVVFSIGKPLAFPTHLGVPFVVLSHNYGYQEFVSLPVARQVALPVDRNGNTEKHTVFSVEVVFAEDAEQFGQGNYRPYSTVFVPLRALDSLTTQGGYDQEANPRFFTCFIGITETDKASTRGIGRAAAMDNFYRAQTLASRPAVPKLRISVEDVVALDGDPLACAAPATTTRDPCRSYFINQVDEMMLAMHNDADRGGDGGRESVASLEAEIQSLQQRLQQQREKFKREMTALIRTVSEKQDDNRGSASIEVDRARMDISELVEELQAERQQKEELRQRLYAAEERCDREVLAKEEAVKLFNLKVSELKLVSSREQQQWL
mmetsp:Transcript_57321/g.123038  ORF Transcript_57321/g.123038 Transcript_57321/m.123038 type:complete len:328 (-) Transcript_57321:66-1049(-)